MTYPLIISQIPSLIVLAWLLFMLHRKKQYDIVWLVVATAFCTSFNFWGSISIISTQSLAFDYAGIINRLCTPAVVPLLFLCYCKCIEREVSWLSKALLFAPPVLLFAMSFFGNTPLPSYLTDSDEAFESTIHFNINQNVCLGWSITEIVLLIQSAWAMVRIGHDVQLTRMHGVMPGQSILAIKAVMPLLAVIAIKSLVGCHVWMNHQPYALLFYCFATYCICYSIKTAHLCFSYDEETVEEDAEEISTTDRKQLILQEEDEIQKEAYLATLQNVKEKDVEEMTHKELLILQLRTLIEQEKIYLKAGLKLDEVALTLGTNRTYLSRMMMETYNHTFSEQMNLFRLESAKEDMLRRRGTSIESIALSNGFNSANTFNKVFNQHFNCSPAIWRNNHLDKSEEG